MAEHLTDSLLNPEVFSMQFSVAGEQGMAMSGACGNISCGVGNGTSL